MIVLLNASLVSSWTPTASTSWPPATPLDGHEGSASMYPSLSGWKNALYHGMPCSTGPLWSSRRRPYGDRAQRYPPIVPRALSTLQMARPDEPVSSGGYSPGYPSALVASE